MTNPAPFDESREEVCGHAHSHSFLVIEGAPTWASLRSFLKTDDPCRFHDNRSESTTFARPWQNNIDVVEHAASVLCHPPSWDTIMKSVPNSSYTIGAPHYLYEYMTLTTFGPNDVAPFLQLLSQRFNGNTRFLCHLMEVSTMFFHPTHRSTNIGKDSCSKLDRAGHEQ